MNALSIRPMPLVFDLPDDALGAHASLCRFVSESGGMEMRGIVQAKLVEDPLPARSTTWGAVKALYR